MAVSILDEKTFNEKIINNKETALVDFFATWCMPCKMFSPILDAIAEEFEGRVGCYKVDVDNGGDIPAKYEVMSVPSILLFKDGEVIDSFTGSLPKDRVKDFLVKNLG